MRKSRAYISGISIIILSFFIHYYVNESQLDIDFPAILYGIPTYKNSKLNRTMSSTGDPYIFVFLTKDNSDQVLKYYQKELNIEHQVLKYGRGAIVNLVIYQFTLLKGEILNFPYKGVEIIPLNSFYQRIYGFQTKIKIYIPREEISATTS
jgi:hypothetical protein